MLPEKVFNTLCSKFLYSSVSDKGEVKNFMLQIAMSIHYKRHNYQLFEAYIPISSPLMAVFRGGRVDIRDS